MTPTLLTGSPSDAGIAWGWNPESVGAIGAAGATVFAAIAAVVAVTELVNRRLQDARQQALRIAAWTILERPAAGHDGVVVRRLHVANRSDLPIFKVGVECDSRLGDDQRPVFHWHSLGPGEEQIEDLEPTDAHDALGYPGHVMRLDFDDHRNRHWQRGEDGTLCRRR